MDSAPAPLSSAFWMLRAPGALGRAAASRGSGQGRPRQARSALSRILRLPGSCLLTTGAPKAAWAPTGSQQGSPMGWGQKGKGITTWQRLRRVCGKAKRPVQPVNGIAVVVL